MAATKTHSGRGTEGVEFFDLEFESGRVPRPFVSLRYTLVVRDEYALIGVFFRPSKRERYCEMLSSPRRRKKFVDQLAHFDDFDPAYRLPIPSKNLHAGNIRAELKSRQSPTSVYAISELSTLDQKELPLVEALEETVGRGMGTILSCIPGQLAFVETEDERYILEHPRSARIKG